MLPTSAQAVLSSPEVLTGYVYLLDYHTKGTNMAHRYDSELNENIWHNIILHQNELLHTAKGLPFTYSIKTLPDGTLGNEIVVSRRSKTITRATVDKAYQKVVELGEVKGPKQLGVFGASYLYVIFKAISVIKETGVNGDGSVIKGAGVTGEDGVNKEDGMSGASGVDSESEPEISDKETDPEI